MLSNRLPTGTVSPDGSRSHTYPRDNGERLPGSEVTPRRVETADTRLNDLRDENERLREQNARLRAQLDAAREGRQDIIDRYEYLVADVQTESEPAQVRRQQSPRGRLASLVGRAGELLGRLFPR